MTENSADMSSTSQSDWVQAYDWAVVRLITHIAAGSKASRLLFGTVSLLSKERPRPASSAGLESCKVRSGRDGKLFFRRTTLSAADAITWYRSNTNTGLLTPVPSCASEVDPKLDGFLLAPMELVDDPQWPSLGLPVAADWDLGGPGNPAPFIGAGAQPALIHRRFGRADTFDAILRDTRAIEFIKRRLHIDLLAYREYLGSLTLIAPDPILKTIRNFIAEDKRGKGEDLVFRFVPRTGQTLAGLQGHGHREARQFTVAVRDQADPCRWSDGCAKPAARASERLCRHASNPRRHRRSTATSIPSLHQYQCWRCLKTRQGQSAAVGRAAVG